MPLGAASPLRVVGGDDGRTAADTCAAYTIRSGTKQSTGLVPLAMLASADRFWSGSIATTATSNRGNTMLELASISDASLLAVNAAAATPASLRSSRVPCSA